MKKSNNKDEITKYINKYNLSNHLNEELIYAMQIHKFDEGEQICFIDKKIEYFYLLVKGKCSVQSLSSNGKSLLISFYNPIALVGDLEFIGDPTATCNLFAMKKTTFLAIPMKVVSTFGYDDPKFLRFIISSLGDKLITTSNYSSINLLNPLENRFASYLLSSHFHYEQEGMYVYIDKLTHIAELLGTSYRHLNRIINNLSKDNVIKKKGNKVYIINKKKLEMIGTDHF